MQAALECFRDPRDLVFLEVDVQVVPCPLLVSCASVEWVEVEGPFLLVYTVVPHLSSCQEGNYGSNWLSSMLEAQKLWEVEWTASPLEPAASGHNVAVGMKTRKRKAHRLWVFNWHHSPTGPPALLGLLGRLGLEGERWSLSQFETGLSGPVRIPAGMLKEWGAVTVGAALGTWSATCK